MKSLFSIALLLFSASLTTYAQTTVRTDISSLSRPRYSGEYSLIYDNGQLFYLPKTGSPFALQVDNNNVVGLTARFADYYRSGRIDTLLSAKADAGSVYSRTEASLTFKPIDYRPNWNTDVGGRPDYFPSRINLVPGLSDSLNTKLSRSEYQALSSGVASTSTTYSKAETNTLFAPKGTTLQSYSIGNAYTKTETDEKQVYSSAKDLAAQGGFALLANGSDMRAALQYALSNPGPSNGVRLPVGIYYVSGPLDIQAGRQLTFDFGAQIRVLSNFAPEPLAGNDGRYVLRVRGAGVKLSQISIDCMGLQAAPILILFADDVVVEHSTVSNWRIGGLGQHGIAVLASRRCRVLYNTLINGEHGINVFRSDGTISTGNFVDVMVHGGIYCVFTRNFTSVNDFVSNCGDVGKDSEGGEHNYWYGGLTTRCKNGELAIFSGDNNDSYVSNHIVFSCPAERVSQYTTMNATGTTSTTALCDAQYGAATIMSLDEGCYESGFTNCRLSSSYGPAFFHNQLGDKNGRRIFFKNNDVVTTAAFWRCLNSDGLEISGNTFRGLAGAETSQNETRDMHAGRLENNAFRYDVVKPSGYAVLLNTASGYATTGTVVTRNSFENCGTFSFQYDPFQNGSLIATLWNNDLGNLYTANGGLSVTANATGGVALRDQKLKILLGSSPAGAGTNLGSLDGISRAAGPLKAHGNVGLGRPGYNGLFGDVHLIRGSGNVNVYALTTIPATGFSLSASGSSLTLTNTTGTATNGFLDLTLNSY